MKSKETYLAKITEIFRKELNDPSLILTYDSSPNTVEKWDSINNLVLITSIEEEFGINFPIEFIFKVESVGDFCDFLMQV